MNDNINDLFEEYVELQTNFRQYLLLGAKNQAKKIQEKMAKLKVKIREADEKIIGSPTLSLLPDKCASCILKSEEERMECFDKTQGECPIKNTGSIEDVESVGSRIIIALIFMAFSMITLSFLFGVYLFFVSTTAGIVGIVTIVVMGFFFMKYIIMPIGKTTLSPLSLSSL